MILALLVLLLWEPLINLPLLSNIIPKWIGLTIVILFIIWMTNLYLYFLNNIYITLWMALMVFLVLNR